MTSEVSTVPAVTAAQVGMFIARLTPIDITTLMYRSLLMTYLAF